MIRDAPAVRLHTCNQINGQNAWNIFFASVHLHNNSVFTSSDVDTPLEYFYIVELQQW